MPLYESSWMGALNLSSQCLRILDRTASGSSHVSINCTFWALNTSSSLQCMFMGLVRRSLKSKLVVLPFQVHPDVETGMNAR